MVVAALSFTSCRTSEHACPCSDFQHPWTLASQMLVTSGDLRDKQRLPRINHDLPPVCGRRNLHLTVCGRRKADTPLGKQVDDGRADWHSGGHRVRLPQSGGASLTDGMWGHLTLGGLGLGLMVMEKSPPKCVRGLSSCVLRGRKYGRQQFLNI